MSYFHTRFSGGFATVGTKTFYWSPSEVIWEEALVGCDGNKTLAAVMNQAEMDVVMQKSDTGKLIAHYFLWNSGLGAGESFSLLLLEWRGSFKVRVNVASPTPLFSHLKKYSGWYPIKPFSLGALRSLQGVRLKKLPHIFAVFEHFASSSCL